MFKVTNLTYQPLRIIMNGYDKVLPGRPIKKRDVYIEKLNNQLRKMQRIGLIKIKEM